MTVSPRWRSGTTLIQNVSVETCWRPLDGNVGGDFFDVIDLGANRVAVIVGDAAGHGPAAAAVAGALSAETKEAFSEIDDPLELFARLDERLVASQVFHTATAACLVIDTDAQQMQLANAGHPPVIVVDEAGSELLDGRADTLLGLPSLRHRTVRPLNEGAMAFVYTDGLIERRGVPLDQSLRRLRVLCARVTASVCAAWEVARRVDERFGVPQDDATILAIRIRK